MAALSQILRGQVGRGAPLRLGGQPSAPEHLHGARAGSRASSSPPRARGAACSAPIRTGLLRRVGEVPRDSDTWTGEWRCLPGCMGATGGSASRTGAILPTRASNWAAPATATRRATPTGGSGRSESAGTHGHGGAQFSTCPWHPTTLELMMETHEAEIADATCECCSTTRGPTTARSTTNSSSTRRCSRRVLLDHIQAVVFPADTSHGHGVEHSLEHYARQVEELKHKGVHVPLVRYDALCGRRSLRGRR